MPGTPLFVQAATGDTAPQFSAMDYRRIVQAMSPERVLSSTAFRVRQRAAGANFQVEVDPGQAVVAGDDVANQGNYLCTGTVVETLTVPAAPATGTRQHRVVLQVRDKFHASYSNPYQWTIDLLPDTGSGLPPLPASALDLATVNVAAAQATVVDANITDNRYLYDTRINLPTAGKVAANFTVQNLQIVRIGVLRHIYMFFTYTGATTITSDSRGNINDTAVMNAGTLPAGDYRTWGTIYLYGEMPGVNGAGVRLNADGSIQLVDLSGSAGGTITSGTTFQLDGIYCPA